MGAFLSNTGRFALLTVIFAVVSACQSPVIQVDGAASAGSVSTEEVQGEARVLGAPGTNHPASGAYSPVSEASWGSGTWSAGANFVTTEGGNLRIGVYSANATKILLEFYSAATGQEAAYDYWMVKGSDNVWRAEIASVPGKTLYAFRAWGPNWPFSASWTRGHSAAGFVSDVDLNGNRFNPNKVLYDPYAVEMSHDKTTPALVAAGENGGMFGTGGTDVAAGQTYTGPLTGGVAINRRNVDTAKWAPKSVALKDATSFGTKPAIAEKDSIVYEAHVRGLTQHSSVTSLQSILSGISGFSSVVNIPAAYQGTYKAAGLLAPYIKALGVNVIELLPVHETDNDNNSGTSPGGNFWGYMTYGYFAPDRRYSYDKALGGPTREFKEMVKAFHDQGIEVWLDVVYNHTGEGGNWDATKKVAEMTSFRGLDNQTYYALVSSDKSSYWETTGCGNNVNTGNAAVSKMIKDSLTYWTTSMGLDGFRFDLAPVLGRDAAPNYYFNSGAQLLLDIAAMTTTYNVEMIAEAWDIGTYQVGNFPNKWGEWNGRYRDAARRFLRGDTSGAGGISYADAFYGDWGYFNDQGGPDKSVNFIVAHDGFTTADLVSYNGKTNTARAWPFGPSDGGNDSNESWDSAGDQSLRRQRDRNFFVWQMFSRGVPMIVYGDEFARTQNGNNNPYNIDSVATWNNYNMIASDSPQAVATGTTGEAYHNNFGTDTSLDGKNALFLFNTYVMNLRKNASALRQGDYSMGIGFSKNDGSAGFNSYADRCVRVHIDGSAAGDTDYLMFVNMYTATVGFTAPAADTGKKWIRIIDTGAWAEGNNNYWTDAAAWTLSGTYNVVPWSIVVFKSVSASAPSSNADLSALSVGAGALSPAFAAATTAYSVSAIYSTATSTVTATRADAGASLQYQVNAGAWTALTSGSASAAFPLSVGANTVNVKATAADGTTTKTYTVTINRTAASANADLSSLGLASATLSPAFAAATTAYTSSVAYSVSSTAVTAVRAQAGATLQYQVGAGAWNVLTSGTASSSIALAVGANTINVKATAENGTTTKTYTVTVTRQAASTPNAQLKITLKTGSNSENVKFPGDFNSWNINTTQAISTGANSTASLTVSSAVLTANLNQGSSATALEFQVINVSGGGWSNYWSFATWTKVGCTVPDGKQITIAATDQDVVNLTIDITTNTLTATVEAR